MLSAHTGSSVVRRTHAPATAATPRSTLAETAHTGRDECVANAPRAPPGRSSPLSSRRCRRHPQPPTADPTRVPPASTDPVPDPSVLGHRSRQHHLREHVRELLTRPVGSDYLSRPTRGMPRRMHPPRRRIRSARRTKVRLFPLAGDIRARQQAGVVIRAAALPTPPHRHQRPAPLSSGAAEGARLGGFDSRASRAQR